MYFLWCFLKNGAGISAGEQAGVKGAVLWRSSRPLTAACSPPQLAWERRSEFFSELRSIVEKPVLLLRPRPKPVTLNQSFFDGNRFGSINHVFGPVLLHDCLFKLPKLARETGRPIRVSA
jgi:hypothetical protein